MPEPSEKDTAEARRLCDCVVGADSHRGSCPHAWHVARIRFVPVAPSQDGER